MPRWGDRPQGARFRGRLIVLSGPSGAGKSTIAEALLRRRPDLVTVTSRTTRPPRPGDGKGKSYEHVSREAFERHRADGGFLESAEVHGDLYGTPKDEVERALAVGRNVLLEIDPQGARQVKGLIPGAITIFVDPPDWETLEARLRARGTEDEARMARRLASARQELADAGDFDHRVVNDQLEQAVEQVNRILEQVIST
ncbi:MAG: guanylate kinase [Actinomycetota bacterium]